MYLKGVSSAGIKSRSLPSLRGQDLTKSETYTSCPRFARVPGSGRKAVTTFLTPTTELAAAFCQICRISVFGSSRKNALFGCVFRRRAFASSISMASRKCWPICVLTDSAFKRLKRITICEKKSNSSQVPVPVTSTRRPKTNEFIRKRWRRRNTIRRYGSMCFIKNPRSNKKARLERAFL